MYHAMFQALDAVLTRYQAFWHFEPMQVGWPATWPAPLLNQLQGYSLADCADIDASASAQADQFLPYFADLFAALPQLDTVDTAPSSWPFWLHTDVPGRKWQQICRFSDALQWTGTDAAAPVLEWCAGKGHLGRLLAHQGAQAVTSLEWQAALCEQGSALSQQRQLPQQFVAVDVLTQNTAAWFNQSQRFVAMHACGELHRVGMRHALAHQVAELAVLPCCYHLQPSSHYQPHSRAAQASALQLTKANLRLAVQQQATAGLRVKRLGQQEMLWRHAWRHWQQHLQPNAPYQPLRSFPKQILTTGLAEFFAFAACEHQCALPDPSLWPLLLEQAQQSLLQQRRLELVQHLFRRPLELWLVLDLVLWLQQQGYRVQLLQLCEAALTPRNVLIRAWR